MEVKLTVKSLLAIIIFACVNDLTFTEDIPIDIDEDLFSGMEENFLSLLSDELKEKLLKKSGNEGKGIDIENIVMNELSESERKEVEQALMSAFQPFFGEFLQTVSKTGFPPLDKLNDHISKNQTEEKVPVDKNLIDEDEEEVEQKKKEVEKELRDGVKNNEGLTVENEKGQKEDSIKQEKPKKNKAKKEKSAKSDEVKKGDEVRNKKDKDEL